MKIGIIGCGNMGGAIAKRMTEHHQMFLCSRHVETAQRLAKEINGVCCHTVAELVEQAELIIIAVKPKDLSALLTQWPKNANKEKTVVSVLAGTSLKTLSESFHEATIVRMMPNLAIVQGEGIAGFSALETFSSENKERLTQLFSPLGLVKWLPEAMMDAFTALAGSGPAFVLVMIESMVEAAITMGFSAVEGQQLVVKMMQGTLSMLQDSKKHPAELKWQIASPGGTTIAGLNELDACGLRTAIIQTFLATYEKAQSM